jgi:uncharacterized protein
MVMLLQNQLKDVAFSQWKAVANSKITVARTTLTKIKTQKQFALIVTGVRRSGKSTLLLQYVSKYYKKPFYLHFEDIRLAGFEQPDFERLLNLVQAQKPDIVFFDEIQVVTGWEIFVRHLLDYKFNVCITGSNASLLSSELGSKLTGRYLQVELFTFSYVEFLQLTKAKSSQRAAEKYLWQGGFPEYLKTNNGQILNQLLDDILVRDIAVRYGIKNIVALRQLAIYLITNIGKPISANQLTKLFNISAASTLLEYISYLENAYIIQLLPQYSTSIKKQIRNPKKVYVIDNGLFTHNSISFSEDYGRRLENLVYLQLRKRYKKIYYFNDSVECDFIATENEKVKLVMQVCYKLHTDNLQREVNGLMVALAHFKLTEGIIVSLQENDIIKQDGYKIHILSLEKFLLEYSQ